MVVDWMWRTLVIVLGVAIVANVVTSWRSETMPMTFGEDDAEYFARQEPRSRRFRLVFFALLGLMLIVAGALGQAT